MIAKLHFARGEFRLPWVLGLRFEYFKTETGRIFRYAQ